MHRLCFFLAAVFCLLLVGCGGSGNALSPYEGIYSGTYATNSETGTVDLTIDQNGDVTGTTTANSSGIQTRMTGVIQNNGDITGDFVYRNSNVDDPYGGFLHFDQSNGDLVGDLNISTSTGRVTAHFILQRTSFKKNPNTKVIKVTNPNAKAF